MLPVLRLTGPRRADRRVCGLGLRPDVSRMREIYARLRPQRPVTLGSMSRGAVDLQVIASGGCPRLRLGPAAGHSRRFSVPVGMVIVVTASGTVFVDRPVLAAVTEALSGAGGTDFTIAGSGAVLEVSSQRPVLSPQFEPRAEAALSAVLRDVAATLPGARCGVVAVEQFRGPWGVPDLAALAPARLERRLACAVPPLLSQHDCRLVAAAGKWIEPAALAAAARVSSGSARQVLAQADCDRCTGSA